MDNLNILFNELEAVFTRLLYLQIALLNIIGMQIWEWNENCSQVKNIGLQMLHASS